MNGCGSRDKDASIHDFNFNEGEIKPGFCDPYDCPKPKEVVCVKVDKVFEECKDAKVNTRDVDLAGQVEGCISKVKCIKAELVVDPVHPRECEILPCGRVKSSFFYRFKFRWWDDLGKHVFTSDPIKFEKIARMKRAGEPGLSLQCEIFVELIDCFLINSTTVRCCIGKLVLFKLYANVQLLIPAYGYCPKPDDCKKVVPQDCPDEEEWLAGIKWPPHYPEQIRPILKPPDDEE